MSCSKLIIGLFAATLLATSLPVLGSTADGSSQPEKPAESCPGFGSKVGPYNSSGSKADTACPTPSCGSPLAPVGSETNVDYNELTGQYDCTYSYWCCPADPA